MTKRLRPVFIILSLFLFTLTVGADIGRREFFTVNASRGLAVNSVQEIVCTKTGRMMIITEGNLNFYDGSTFNHIDTKHDFEMQLPAFQGEDRMEFDSIHHLWIKRHGNVTCVDLLNEKFIEKPKDVIEEMGCKEQVLDLFADEGSGIWLLTKTGLFNIAKPEQVFQTVPDRNLQEVDVFENLLVTFYDNGEFIAYDLKTSKIVQHTRPYEWETALKYTKSTKFLRYEDGYYIVKKGKNGSVLLRYNIHKQEWKIITETTYFFNDLALLGNKLYIASSEGYWIYFIDYDVLKQADDIKFMHSSEMKLQCNAIAFDKQDGLWIGTQYRGVLYARPRTSPFYSYSFDSPEGCH